MNESEYHDLLLTAARRELTPSEYARLEAWFQDHPAAREDWVLERRLTRSLNRLAEVPVASNFTTAVVEAAARAAHRETRRQQSGWLRWAGKLGYGWQLAAVLGVLALVVSLQLRQAHQRAELAHSLEALPVASLADLELWRDFESINALPTGPVPSVDQLAEALK